VRAVSLERVMSVGDSAPYERDYNTPPLEREKGFTHPIDYTTGGTSQTPPGSLYVSKTGERDGGKGRRRGAPQAQGSHLRGHTRRCTRTQLAQRNCGYEDQLSGLAYHSQGQATRKLGKSVYRNKGGRGRASPPRRSGRGSTLTTRRSERQRGSFLERNLHRLWAAEQSARRHRHPTRGGAQLIVNWQTSQVRAPARRQS
jgi:hypothetical protein